MRFNFIRAALHFGSEGDVEQALAVARATLSADQDVLEIDHRDDVMTWDYCTEFFNYRSYFDLATECFMDGETRTPALKRLILASIAHYCGRMTGDIAYFADAAARDPVFPAYRLAYAKALIRQNVAPSADQAAALLTGLCAHTLLAAEASSLLKALKNEHNIVVPDGKPIGVLESRTVLDSDYEAIRNGPYFRAQRNLSTTLRHRRFLFTDSFLLLWKWRVG